MYAKHTEQICLNLKFRIKIKYTYGQLPFTIFTPTAVAVVPGIRAIRTPCQIVIRHVRCKSSNSWGLLTNEGSAIFDLPHNEYLDIPLARWPTGSFCDPFCMNLNLFGRSKKIAILFFWQVLLQSGFAFVIGHKMSAKTCNLVANFFTLQALNSMADLVYRSGLNCAYKFRWYHSPYA